MTDEAISNDASDGEENAPEEVTQQGEQAPAKAAPRNPRQEAMDRIAKNVREERGRAAPEDETDDQPEVTPEPPVETKADLPDGIYQKDGEFYFKAKVDGEEVELPYKKAIAQIQKQEAADRRLQQAVMVQRELEQERARLQQLQEQLQAQSQKAAESSQSQPPPEDGDADKRVDAIIDNLYDGNADEAKAALRELLNRQQTPPPTPTVDPTAIEQSVIQRIKEEQRAQEQQAAIARFRSDNPDVFEDPELYSLVDQLGLHVQNSDPTLDTYQVLARATDMARKARGEGQTDQNVRQERKRQAAAPVTGVNQRGSLGKDAPPPKTYSQKIEEIKRARGQRVA